MYNYRINIQFWWYVTRKRKKYNGYSPIEDRDRNWDAFVSYSSLDDDFVQNKLVPNLKGSEDEIQFEICLDCNDFIPGVTIVDNIEHAIDKSNWVIFIISKNFLLSDWCKYEVRQAEIKCFDARENVTILIFLEGVKYSKLPKSLKILSQNVTYLKWNEGEEKEKMFFKKLKILLARKRITNSE